MAEDQAEGKRTGGKSRSCVRRRVSLAGWGLSPSHVQAGVFHGNGLSRAATLEEPYVDFTLIPPRSV